MRLRVGYSPSYGLDHIALFSAHQPAPCNHQAAEHSNSPQVGQKSADVDGDGRDDKRAGDRDRKEQLTTHGVSQGKQEPASG